MNLDYAVPIDPALPQLSAVLDVARMTKVFTESVLSSGLDDVDRYHISACDIGRVKYKAGKRCTIGYRLTIRDQKADREAEQLLCGRLYERGGSLARYRRACMQPLVTPAFGPALFHIAALEMIVWAFPNDRKLGGLRILTDDAYLRERALPGIVDKTWGSDWRLKGFDRQLASYVPEGRCTVRFDLSLIRDLTGEERTWVIFGKSHREETRNTKAYRALELLWDHDARQGCVSRSPCPLAYEAPLQLYWQEAVKGKTRLDLRIDSAADGDLYATAAVAIADLHRTPLNYGPDVSPGHVIKDLRTAAKSLSEAVYDDGPDLAQIVSRLIENAPPARPDVRATLHGDLHPKNIYFDGERVSFIDLDDLSTGAPEFDVGSFFARVLHHAVADGDSPAKAFAQLQSFFTAYRRRAPWPMNASAVAWYTAAALINERAFRGWTRLSAGWQEVNDGLIRLVDRISWSGENALGLADCDAV